VNAPTAPAAPSATATPTDGGRLTKSFPVFDCDAHINDPLAIWRDYVAEADREAVRRFYWQDEQQTVVNNRSFVMGGQSHYFRPLYNPIHMAGPQMTKPIIRKLLTDVVLGRLGPAEMEQVEHDGAVDPHARLADMDLMGIDQVMVIPTMMVMHVPFGEDPEGARGFARAYNDWARDFCAVRPDRLFPAAWLPLQSPAYTVREIEHRAEQGFRLGLVRPIDARHGYPNRIGAGGLMGGVGGGASFDHVFRAFEETGMVLGMHTFPPPNSAEYYDGERPPYVVSPGEFAADATDPARGQRVEGQALSFIFEAQTWLVQVLLSGFLDRYPGLRMAILESNSSWLRSVLAHCDRLFRLQARERRTAARRLPSEAFAEQCFIAFESDERPMFRQWRFYEDLGIWSSDAYHTDGADVWSAMREMADAGVPEAVQAKFLGANARRAYRIDPVTYVDAEPPPIERPAWFPQGEELERFAKLMRDPRANAAEIGALLMGTGEPAARPSAGAGAY
jgi:predicted TIM-barrel fold metal-dependent hydrolase